MWWVECSRISWQFQWVELVLKSLTILIGKRWCSEMHGSLNWPNLICLISTGNFDGSDSTSACFLLAILRGRIWWFNINNYKRWDWIRVPNFWAAKWPSEPQFFGPRGDGWSMVDLSLWGKSMWINIGLEVDLAGYDEPPMAISLCNSCG